MKHKILLVSATTVLLFLVFLYVFTIPVVQEAPNIIGEFGGVSLIIELATSTQAQVRGLSGRQSIPNSYGMLFVFDDEEMHGFWMKDMQMPIDIFWLDTKGHVVGVRSNVATSTYPSVFYPPEPVRYVLETSAGFAVKNNIATGTQLVLPNLRGVFK